MGAPLSKSDRASRTKFPRSWKQPGCTCCGWRQIWLESRAVPWWRSPENTRKSPWNAGPEWLGSIHRGVRNPAGICAFEAEAGQAIGVASRGLSRRFLQKRKESSAVHAATTCLLGMSDFDKAAYRMRARVETMKHEMTHDITKGHQ